MAAPGVTLKGRGGLNMVYNFAIHFWRFVYRFGARCLKALSLQSRDEKRTSGFNRLETFRNSEGFCFRI
jgi:hypothetical protein